MRDHSTRLWAKFKKITSTYEMQGQFLLRGATRQDCWVGWNYPHQAGIRSILTDSHADRKAVQRLGVWLRDEHGKWYDGIMRNLGNGSPLAAELWGALIGLRLAWRLGVI